MLIEKGDHNDCKNPFLNEDVEDQWTRLLERQPDLSVNMHKGAAKKWNGTQP
jgi:hypothetical protein